MVGILSDSARLLSLVGFGKDARRSWNVVSAVSERSLTNVHLKLFCKLCCV